MKENSREEDIILLKDFTEGNFKRDKLENYKGSYKMGYFYYKDIQQALEHILSDYKRVLKENDEWQRAYQEEKDKQFELIQNTNNTIKTANIAIKDLQEKLKEVIPVQKVKDKIEEILNNGEYRIIFEGDAEFPDEATCIDAQKYIKLEKLQELLEGRK